MAKDVSIIVKAIDQVTAPIREMNSRLKGFADGVSGFWKGMVGGLAAIGLTSLLRESVKEAAQAEEGWGRLGVSVKNVGGDFSTLRPELEASIAATQKMSVATDDDLRDALTNLITISGDYQGSLKNLTLVADVAAFKHIGVAEAADMVGKAMTGNEKVFKGFGIVAGDNASKMSQLRATVAGFSQNEAETFNGQLKRIGNAWDEVQRALGEAIVGNQAMRGNTNLLVESLVKLEHWIHDNEDTIGRLVTVVVKFSESIGKILGTSLKGWGLIFQQLGIGGKKAAADVEASQAAQTVSVQTHGLKRTKVTKEEETAREAAVKKSHENIKALDEAASKAALELLSANQKTYEETERTFKLKMEGMTKEDYAKAEALLKQTHQNQLLAWAGFNATLETIVPHGQQTARKELLTTSIVTEDFTAVLAKHGKVLTEAQRKALEHAASNRALKDSIIGVADAVMNGADALGGMLEVLGLADEKTRALTSGIGDLGEGVKKALKGDIVGGILQGLGGIKNVLGGLFGKSAAEKALEAALDKNRVSLEHLRETVGDLNINLTGKQLAGTQGALKDFFASGGASQKGWGDRLGQLLLARGVNMSDLEEVAKTLNIDIKPGGHLSPQALAQLQQAIGLVEPTQFRNNFKGQKEALGHEATLFNLSPEEQAARLAALAGGSLGSGRIGAALGGLDFSSAGGRASGLSAIQGLFSALPGFGAADLGGLTGSEFVSVLEELKSLLETANQNAESGPTGLPGDVSVDAGSLGSLPTVGPLQLPSFELGGNSYDRLFEIAASTAGMFSLMSGRAAAGSVLNDSRVTLTIDNLNVYTAATDAKGISAGIMDAIDRELASRYRLQQLAQGDATRTG